jgi:serine/threonine protein kinase
MPPFSVVLSVDPPLPFERVRQPVPFGKYLLLDRISVGGMAEVFKAKSYGVEGFEKIIAIKRILPTMGEDRDFIKMFIDEAKIAGQLAHANICQIFELGRIDGSHFIAMEYIWGKDLLQIQNRLRKIKQPMPIAMACFTIAKVLEGLDYAHRKRDPLGRPLEIVHRDCSPQNVLVSYEGEVKIIDFGIAKATSRNSRTMAGVLKGKFGYMSPEQVRGLPLDRRSDIFALGTMLYECLTGDRLFQGETDFSTLEKVRNVDIRPPREINPNIPPAVEAVILKALAKDVEERYQWCSEMLADLQAFLMAQDVVFTAKSLSSWLKEVFSIEIDRERQQLEQYKRVGRDGLIDGVPAADAKVDIVDRLGEAGPAEGDPTMLGEPNFDDIERVAAVSAEVGPAPGSPAARGAEADDDEDGEAFGEEAPTEIFGEINHGAHPVATPILPTTRPPTSQPPQTRPPRPPPSSRLPTARGDLFESARSTPAGPTTAQQPSGSPSQSQPRPPSHIPPHPSQMQPRPAPPPPQEMGMAGASPGFAMQNYANPANAGAAYSSFGQPPGPGAPLHPQPHPSHQMASMAPTLVPTSSQPIALGTPGAVPAGSSQPTNGMPPQHPGATLLGAAPPNVRGYAPGYPPPAQYPGPAMLPPHGPHGPQGPHGPHGPHGPQMMYPPQGYPPNPYGPPQHPYTTTPAYAAVSAIEQTPPVAGTKRSSIVRDVAIGVAIAALVLGGFLVVKFLILEDGAPRSVAATTAVATIRLAMPASISADLFVDDKKVAIVGNEHQIPVTAGQRKVKLVGPKGVQCEKVMTLAAGKVTTLDCALDVAVANPGEGSAKPAEAAGGGSASAPAVGSASVPAGASTSPSGSGAPVAPANEVKPGEVKPPDAKPVDARPAAPVSDKAASSDKMPIEDKARPADKVADKAPIEDKAKPADKAADRMPTEDRARPADKAAEKPRQVERPRAERQRPPVEDDPLGTLQGGTKPGEAKPEVKKPGKAEPSARAPVDTRGYLAVISKPVAKIAVDGVDTGLSTPISGHTLPLTPGKHKVTFVLNDAKHTFTVVIKAGEITTLQKDL